MGTQGAIGLAALAGAVLGVMATLAWLVPRAAPREMGSAGPLETNAHPALDVSAIAPLAEEVRELRASLAAVDEKLDRALAGRDRSAGASTGADTSVTIDPDMLQRAIAQAQTQAERDKFLAMTPGEVLQSAQELINSRSDLGKARKMLEDLLARPLAVDDRQKALLQLGIGLRNGGDLEESKASLQRAIDLAGGTENESGAWAAFQMAWTCEHQNDTRAARQWFEQVGRSSGSGDPLRIEGRWNAAKLAAADGDPGARAEFESILHDYGDNPAFAHIIADVKARLGL